MSWATQYINRLMHGHTVQFRPQGGSMKGKIESGQLVTVEPIDDHDELKVGDIVLCRVNGNQYLHLIKSIQPGWKFVIGNNKGLINGTVGATQIYGICTKIE